MEKLFLGKKLISFFFAIGCCWIIDECPQNKEKKWREEAEKKTRKGKCEMFKVIEANLKLLFCIFLVCYNMIFYCMFVYITRVTRPLDSYKFDVFQIIYQFHQNQSVLPFRNSQNFLSILFIYIFFVVVVLQWGCIISMNSHMIWLMPHS